MAFSKEPQNYYVHRVISIQRYFLDFEIPWGVPTNCTYIRWTLGTRLCIRSWGNQFPLQPFWHKVREWLPVDPQHTALLASVFIAMVVQVYIRPIKFHNIVQPNLWSWLIFLIFLVKHGNKVFKENVSLKRDNDTNEHLASVYHQL